MGLGELAPFDRVLADKAIGTGSLGKRHRTIARADLAILEDDVFGVEAELLGNGLTQLDTGCVDARRGRISAELSAGARRNRKTRVAELDGDLVDRHSHHLGGGLGDDRVAARPDVGHVGFDRYDAFLVELYSCSGGKDEVVAEGSGDAHADQPVAVPPGTRPSPFTPAKTARHRASGSRRDCVGKKAAAAFPDRPACR